MHVNNADHNYLPHESAREIDPYIKIRLPEIFPDWKKVTSLEEHSPQSDDSGNQVVPANFKHLNFFDTTEEEDVLSPTTLNIPLQHSNTARKVSNSNLGTCYIKRQLSSSIEAETFAVIRKRGRPES